MNGDQTSDSDPQGNQETSPTNKVEGEHQNHAEAGDPTQDRPREDYSDWIERVSRAARIEWARADILGRFNVIFSGIGLAVLIVYAIFTARMYYANQEAAEAAKSAAEAAKSAAEAAAAAQRPWIAHAMHDLNPSDLFDWNRKKYPRKIDAQMFVQNFGNTPALHVATIAVWYPDDVKATGPSKRPPECTAETAPDWFDGHPVRPFVLSPRQMSYWDNSDVHLSDSDLSAIRNGTKNLFMVGCSFYSDEIGRHYRTQICMAYDPPIGIEGKKKVSKDQPWGYYEFSFYRYCQEGNYTETKKDGRYQPD